ncbi:metalloregulator ArsR/SmtB family transcription factor [Rhizobium sp. RU33A]|uniref:ArsR/SmtB family transcription factor n=1 Tax=Rhizobium sp. RU33A TaxID=1907413 RepID=UPI000970909A|nr:metalloregulator ArsR/SmtB family transcription factor [Rhizobium sp. RU33A]
MIFDYHDALKALAHPARLQFLTWLKTPEQYFDPSALTRDGGATAGSFQRTGLSQSAVSSHLGILHRAGLVTSQKSGASVYYRRNEFNITLLKSWLNRQI